MIRTNNVVFAIFLSVLRVREKNRHIGMKMLGINNADFYRAACNADAV